MPTRKTITQSIIEKVQYNTSIPIEATIDSQLCVKLANFYTKPIVTEKVVHNIVADITFQKQLEYREYPDYKTVKFEGSLLSEVVKEVNDQLKSLPDNYEFVFSLPSTDKPIASVKLNSSIEILTLEDEASKYKTKPTKKAKQTSKDRLIHTLIAAQESTRGGLILSDKDTILRIRVKGFVSKYDLVQLKTDDPFYIYKVVMGLFYNQKCLIRKPTYDYSQKNPLSYSVVNRDTNYVVRSFEGDSEDGYFLKRKQFDTKIFEINPLEKKLGLSETSFELVTKYLSKLLKQMSGKGATATMKNQQRRIKNGLYWYYEAEKAHNHFLMITSTISAFDALISKLHKTKESKAEAIAQLVSNTIKEEQYTLDRIIKLYRLRNEIVHGETAISTLDNYSAEGEANAHIAYYGLVILQQYINQRLDRFMKTLVT